MTTTDDQIKPQLPLGFIFLHFFIGLLLAFAVTAVGAVIYAYLDAPEVAPIGAYPAAHCRLLPWLSECQSPS